MGTPNLLSERVVLASPLSWTGSTRRIWRRLRPGVASSEGWGKAGHWAVLWLALIGAWLGVLLWYAALAFFGLIPLVILISYRIVRRNQRRGERNRLRHEETLAAIRQAGTGL